MTNQEAAEKVKRVKGLYAYESDYEALDMAISALEKQMPKRLIAEGDGYADGAMVYDHFYCPSCDHLIWEEDVEDYCPNCGREITMEGEA